jgi:hypothetical protein
MPLQRPLQRLAGVRLPEIVIAGPAELRVEGAGQPGSRVRICLLP